MIIPTIKNGKENLLLAKSFCLDPTTGLELSIPINPQRNMKVLFDFENKDSEEKKVETALEGDALKIKFSNFTDAFGALLVEPITFSIGSYPFTIRIYGLSNNPKVLFLNISIYRNI